jgi:hypothetical protein
LPVIDCGKEIRKNIWKVMKRKKATLICIVTVLVWELFDQGLKVNIYFVSNYY